MILLDRTLDVIVLFAAFAFFHRWSLRTEFRLHERTEERLHAETRLSADVAEGASAEAVRRVLELTEDVRGHEARLQALEGKRGRLQ